MINSRVITNNKNGAEISFSPYMDIFHSGEDEIGLEWNGQAQQGASSGWQTVPGSLNG